MTTEKEKEETDNDPTRQSEGGSSTLGWAKGLGKVEVGEGTANEGEGQSRGQDRRDQGEKRGAWSKHSPEAPETNQSSTLCP